MQTSTRETTRRELQHYFVYSPEGIEVVHDGLQEVGFGEYLVAEGVLDRFQLFRALQMQDRLPGVKLGECAAALGYAPIGAIERLYERFRGLRTVHVG
ncbi:MAG TPA: hypothetical protein VMJ10_31320 [Kofleriaceae bacterium]|nr:hypothetical protein [Kofleriaceae bacterium]